MKKIVGVLFGGKSTEHEVSIHSAQSIIESIDHNKYDVVPLALTKQNKLVAHGGQATMLAMTQGGVAVLKQQCVLPQDEYDALPLAALTKGIVDVILPIMHGNFGEDGRLQGFLEMQGIPYVGSGVLGSALGMDKFVQKQIAVSLNLPHVAFMSFERNSWDADAEAVKDAIVQACGLPCFIKPANNGSSVGIARAATRDELDTLVEAAFLYDLKIIAEAAVENPREVEVAVMGHHDVSAAEHIAEIKPDREFYDYESKYDPTSAAEVIIPASLTPQQKTELRDFAVRVYKMVNASGLARVDFFIDQAGKVIWNEINTLPSFTALSSFSRMWQADGVSHTEVLERLINYAFERDAENRDIHYEA